MGGVLQYKWEAYCGVSLSSKLRSQESTAIRMGGVLPYKLEVYCRTFQTSCRGWGFRNIAHLNLGGMGLQGQARKKSTKTNLFGPETARWGGGLPPEGVGVESFVPSLESLSSLGFEERQSGMSREFCRDVPPWVCSKSFCKKSLCAFFVP